MHWSAPFSYCSHISFTSAAFVFAFSRFFPAWASTIDPITSNAGPATRPPKTAVPPAMPIPPAASEPPPKNARVALVAAAPLRDAIAVPVEAVARTPAALYAPKAAKAPPAAPAIVPRTSDPAKPERVASSSKSFLSI